MSETEQDAAIGRMMREYGEAKKAATSARLELEWIGKSLAKLADVLRAEPERIKVDGSLIFAMRRNVHEEVQSFKVEDIDVARIDRLSSDLRTSTDRILQLEPRLKDLGIILPK